MRSGSPRIVVDTNVLISGTLVEIGASARILWAVRHRRVTLVISAEILTEYENAIRRRHIARKYVAIERRAEDLIGFWRGRAVLIENALSKAGFVPADPKDDVIIATALDGDADYIVSGDRHLTELKEFEGIPILTPAEFVRRFKL